VNIKLLGVIKIISFPHFLTEYPLTLLSTTGYASTHFNFIQDIFFLMEIYVYILPYSRLLDIIISCNVNKYPFYWYQVFIYPCWIGQHGCSITKYLGTHIIDMFSVHYECSFNKTKLYKTIIMSISICNYKYLKIILSISQIMGGVGKFFY